jgi:Spy/CpxP family protein refolding chaperone
MRILSAGLALAVAVALWAAPAAADEKTGQKGLAGGLAARIQDLHLTEQQEARITDIRKEFRPKVQAASKELAAVAKEELDKVQGVLTAAQKQKLQASREELKEMRAESLAEEIAHLGDLDLTHNELAQIADIRKEYRPKIEQTLNKLDGLLTDGQKKARQEALQAGKKHREVLDALRLSDEQKEKVHNFCKRMGTLCREEMEKVRDALSGQQRQQLQEVKEEVREHVRDRMAHRIATLQELNLTEEQKAQITAIRKEYRPKVQEAGNKLRAAVREEVEAIVAVLKG